MSDLASLDLKLVRVSSIGDLSLETLRARVSEIAPDAEIDVNHLYLEQGMPQPQQSTGQVMSWPDHAGPLSRDAGLSIGLIDTRLNPGRVELANSRIIARDFVPYESERPEAHGTAIAAILVGESEQFVGLVPDAELYAASVFFKTPSGTASATTESLVAALDWLIASKVQVINMSLSGPPNAILERAIASVQAQGISVVAAVGNDGPAAAPRYPAAYEGVIGVTAVAPQKKVFRHAGRGHHVDFSAYGVGVRHAGGAEDASVSSGTSFAAPYVTAQFAIAAQVLAPDYLFEAFILSAEDLGPKGYDPIYGHGLLRPLDQYQTAAASEIAPTGQD
ncbi:MAG: S8 family serine peptidase [Pseudomonadota bacterium]